MRFGETGCVAWAILLVVGLDANAAILINTNAGPNDYTGLGNVLYNNPPATIGTGPIIRGETSNSNLIDFFSTSASEQFVNNGGGGGQANILGIDTNSGDPLLDVDIDFDFTFAPANPNVAFEAIFFNVDPVNDGIAETLTVEATDGTVTVITLPFDPTQSQNGILVYTDNLANLIRSVTVHIQDGSINQVRQVRIAGDTLLRQTPTLPEPATLAIWGLGTLGFGLAYRLRRTKS
jgi:hypothetical protein